MRLYQVRLEKKIRKALSACAKDKPVGDLRALLPKFDEWLRLITDSPHSKWFCDDLERVVFNEINK